MNDVYVIADLYGRVLARMTAADATSAARAYEAECKQQRKQTVPYQVLPRSEWIRWQTEQDYSAQAEHLQSE